MTARVTGSRSTSSRSRCVHLLAFEQFCVSTLRPLSNQVAILPRTATARGSTSSSSSSRSRPTSSKPSMACPNLRPPSTRCRCSWSGRLSASSCQPCIFSLNVANAFITSDPASRIPRLYRCRIAPSVSLIGPAHESTCDTRPRQAPLNCMSSSSSASPLTGPRSSPSSGPGMCQISALDDSSTPPGRRR